MSKELTTHQIPHFVEMELMQRYGGLSYKDLNKPLPEEYDTCTITRNLGNKVEVYNICGVKLGESFNLHTMSVTKEKAE